MTSKLVSFNPYSPGFSIYFRDNWNTIGHINSFNPYSPGFSIYLIYIMNKHFRIERLQSLFTWIFYLFKRRVFGTWGWDGASILIHLDFLSILKCWIILCVWKVASILIHLDFLSIFILSKVLPGDKIGFNPYSPGFSIYLSG